MPKYDSDLKPKSSTETRHSYVTAEMLHFHSFFIFELYF